MSAHEEYEKMGFLKEDVEQKPVILRNGELARTYSKYEKSDIAEELIKHSKSFSIYRVSDGKRIAWFIQDFWMYTVITIDDKPVTFTKKQGVPALVQEMANKEEILLTDIQ